MKIALIMLAAGNSWRFGSNKLLYEIEGKPMYWHILEKLLIVAEWLEETCSKSLECDENRLGELKKEINKQCKKTIGLSVGSSAKLSYQNNCYKKITVVTQYEEIEQAARALGANVYINPHPDEGISSSLKIGLKANLDADACLFTVSDQPWLTAETIHQLITLLKISNKGIACVSCDGKLGNPCIFTKRYYDDLLSITGDKGGKAVITAHRDDTAVLKVNDVKELTDMDVKY
ncbi:nucleotidyltransferase family protein [Blautia faecis]|jgi:molybdenum cofactor cytidylyltransferase|uniref:nucleotidyltransferase family protein n=1 Tax=Blautia faecis TaxID=871665 RepID=UPI0016555DA0|nr:nucleotidyltransferase family protein [Blautia faecis]MBC8614700.1 nucleotidyltransferase family protein [Blautia faecis]